MTSFPVVLPHGAAEPGTPPPCPIARLAALLAEEPRLEAVAFNPATRRLSIATLGGDKDGHLARRVTATMLESHEPCPHFRPEKCEVCGVSAEHLPGASRILVSEKLGTTLVRKATCVTALTLWQWVKLVWPAYAPRQKGTIEEHGETEWKSMASLAAATMSVLASACCRSSVARAVMEKTPHVMLVGDGALQFAEAQGFKRTKLLTPESEAEWKEWLKKSEYKPKVNIENQFRVSEMYIF